MEDSTIIKITAVLGLVAIEIANLLTLKVDSAVLGAICAVIGGIAGYEVKANFTKN